MTIPTTTPGREDRATFRVIARRIAVTGVLALAVFALIASTASGQKNARIDGKYGYVTFDAYGEVIKAADIWIDGYGVRAKLEWDGGKASVTAAGDLYPVPKNLSIREGTDVWLTMCYTNNGQTFNCSDPRRAEA